MVTYVLFILLKKFGYLKKVVRPKKPYYVYIRQEHINWTNGKELEFVTRIPDMHSCVINDYLLNRMEYVGNILNKPDLFRLVFDQKIT